MGRIASTGEYENYVCGTGTADSEVWDTGNPAVDEDEIFAGADEHKQENSTPAVITYAAGSPLVGPGCELPAAINYHITFAAGVGVLTISDWAADDFAHTGTRSNHVDGVGALGAGVVLLGPPRNTALLRGPDADDPDCTRGFSLVGAIVATLTELGGV